MPAGPHGAHTAAMTADIMLGLGGVGLFLLGMAILTSSLRDITGDGLRQILVRFTSTPLRGALAGAAATAAMQSSSATTVLAVGFVGAGVLSFSQGLGIVFGANVGTTITGWMVAIIGFKLKLGPVALMFVLAGALLHLFGRGRARQVGWAIAGFGLLFVGIDAMQQGLSQFQNVVTPASFPQDTYLGRLQLVAIGIAVTVLTQSSSAGVAAQSHMVQPYGWPDGAATGPGEPRSLTPCLRFRARGLSKPSACASPTPPKCIAVNL